jgi:hypothetical protein
LLCCIRDIADMPQEICISFLHRSRMRGAILGPVEFGGKVVARRCQDVDDLREGRAFAIGGIAEEGEVAVCRGEGGGDSCEGKRPIDAGVLAKAVANEIVEGFGGE